jgi:hypothetical protein
MKPFIGVIFLIAGVLIAIVVMKERFKAYSLFVQFKEQESNRPEYVLRAITKHFEKIGEQPVEFRISESMNNQKIKDIEVKTIHNQYYRLVMSGTNITASQPIEGFTVGENEWFMRGKVDPIDFTQFSISVREVLKG